YLVALFSSQSSLRVSRHLCPFPTRRSSDLGVLAAVCRGVSARCFGVCTGAWPGGQPKRAFLGLLLAGAERGARALEPARQRLGRSEEHTSELHSRFDLVCRLLLEKKKKRNV